MNKEPQTTAEAFEQLREAWREFCQAVKNVFKKKPKEDIFYTTLTKYGEVNKNGRVYMPPSIRKGDIWRVPPKETGTGAAHTIMDRSHVHPRAVEVYSNRIRYYEAAKLPEGSTVDKVYGAFITNMGDDNKLT